MHFFDGANKNHAKKENSLMEILRVESLSKIYGKGETAVKALDNVSFSVQ